MNKITISMCFVFLTTMMKSQASTFQWAGNLGGAAQEYMYFGSTIDQLSNVYVTGTFLGPGDFDPGVGTYSLTNKGGDGFISKLDATGNFVWAKQLASNNLCEPWAMTSDNTNNIFITGIFTDSLDLDPGPSNYYVNAPGKSVAFFIKVDQNGNFMWGTSFDGTSTNCTSWGGDIGVDALGNSIATGFFGSIIDFDPGPGTYTMDAGPGAADSYIVKISPGGTLVWAKQFDAWGSSSTIKSTDVDALGNIIVCGEFSGTVDFDPSVATYTLDASSGNLFVAKLDANGNLIWAEQIGSNSSGATQCWDLKVSSSGDIYIGGDFWVAADFDPGPGTANFFSSNLDYFIVKLDGAGNYIWAKVTGNLTSYDESVFSLDVDGSGNVYMTGYFRGTVDFDPGPGTYTFSSTFSGDNIYNLNLDASGNFVWANHIEGSWGWGMGICVDAPGNVFTIGYFNGTPDFDPSPFTQFNISAYGAEDIFVQKMGKTSTSIKDNAISKNTYLFPNPNNGQFNFQTDNKGELKVFDITGQIILNEKVGRGVTKINTGSLSKGIYLYSFSSENGQQQKGKLIID